jgi:hypothetical protein
MMKTTVFLTLLAALGTLAIAQPAPSVVFADPFAGRLADGWHWLRENPSHWRLQTNSLDIRVEPGAADSVRNALVRRAPDRTQGSYAIEVTVENLTVPTQQFEQAGITLYSNGSPVFKLVKELVDGQLMIIPGRHSMTEASVQLRLVVSPTGYLAQFRPGARGEFRTAESGTLPPAAREEISLQCYHGPDNAAHWIRFSDFRIIRLPPP